MSVAPEMNAPHSVASAELSATFATDLLAGLTDAEAEARLARYGANEPRRQRRPRYARLALRQLLDPLVALLLVATCVSIAIGDTPEGGAIAAVLFLNAALGFVQEVNAERAILALSQAFSSRAVVVRNGRELEIDAARVVPGDLLLIEEGDRIAADSRLVEATSLQTDESALTGESLPVTKNPDAVTVSAPLAERRSMLYAGTGVTRGRARALAVATGTQTELGRIQELAADAKPPPTPLEQRLARLARQMVVAGVALTLLLTAAALLRGAELHEAFLIGVAVAVAVVPEGLAATVTVALALGARAMARRGAIVRRLDAIETLGETTVICTDKTGTLTENRIRVAALEPAAGVDERELLEAAVLASSARRVGDELRGDPLEVGLLLEAETRGIDVDELRARARLAHEFPFEAQRKRMTRIYEHGDGYRAFAKGAPEVLSDGERDAGLLETATSWAQEGHRVLAIAARSLADPQDGVEHGLDVLGLVAFHDPLRSTSAHALEEARGAGIEVRMLTGDHPATARTIARAIGLDDDAVHARFTPADKLALVEELQACGEVVAMTGDGVNDAPALRRADVGIAMGRSGTQAAREAAAIVLTDDDFATIVAAVSEGRHIGDNLRKVVGFLLSANFGEVLVFAVAITAGLGAPLAVIQVLIVNLVTDGLPALALARDPAAPDTMKPRGARRGTRLFDRGGWWSLAAVGLLVGGATLAAFLAGRALGGGSAQTMAFATLALSELLVVFAVRSPTIPAWRLPANRSLLATAFASAAFVAALVYLPAAHGPVATVSLGWAATLIVGGLALVPLVGAELGKWALSLRRRAQPTA